MAHQAQTLHNMALLLDMPLGRFKDALALEKTAYTVYRSLLGDGHDLTAQSFQYLTRFTNRSVKESQRLRLRDKEMQQQQQQQQQQLLRYGGGGGSNGHGKSSSSSSSSGPSVLTDSELANMVREIEGAGGDGGGHSSSNNSQGGGSDAKHKKKKQQQQQQQQQQAGSKSLQRQRSKN